MESDGEELDYDFDTPQKQPRVSESKLVASADKNRGGQPREVEGAAAAQANADNVDVDGKRGATKKSSDDDHQEDVEEELYGDIVSPGGAGAGGGGGAALLTLQVAEVRSAAERGEGAEMGEEESSGRSGPISEILPNLD